VGRRGRVRANSISSINGGPDCHLDINLARGNWPSSADRTLFGRTSYVARRPAERQSDPRPVALRMLGFEFDVPGKSARQSSLGLRALFFQTSAAAPQLSMGHGPRSVSAAFKLGPCRALVHGICGSFSCEMSKPFISKA